MNSSPEYRPGTRCNPPPPACISTESKLPTAEGPKVGEPWREPPSSVSSPAPTGTPGRKQDSETLVPPGVAEPEGGGEPVRGDQGLGGRAARHISEASRGSRAADSPPAGPRPDAGGSLGVQTWCAGCWKPPRRPPPDSWQTTPSHPGVWSPWAHVSTLHFRITWRGVLLVFDFLKIPVHTDTRTQFSLGWTRTQLLVF